MKKLTRRSIFPMAAVGSLAGIGADPSHAANVEAGNPGIVIRITKYHKGWAVLVPDFEAMDGYWQPGHIMPTKWMPLAEYLAMVDEVYSV